MVAREILVFSVGVRVFAGQLAGEAYLVKRLPSKQKSWGFDSPHSHYLKGEPMKRHEIIFLSLFGLFILGACCFLGFMHGRQREALDHLNETIEQTDSKTTEQMDSKTVSEAWEAAKIFVSASIDAEHTATFAEQKAADVVERTGNGSFTIRATVYCRDVDGQIIPKDFTCKMSCLDGGKWHGVLTIGNYKQTKII